MENVDLHCKETQCKYEEISRTAAHQLQVRGWSPSHCRPPRLPSLKEGGLGMPKPAQDLQDATKVCPPICQMPPIC